jgi:hypothetical protein
MKKKTIIISVLFFVAFLILPIPSIGDAGDFNTISGLWWCSDKPSCLHEMGHRLDWEANWYSDKPEFRDIISSYLTAEIKKSPSDTAMNIMTFLVAEANQKGAGGTTLDIMTYNGTYAKNPIRFTSAELYASIFEWSGGKAENMPEAFRKFYDFQRADELIEKYVR